MKKKLLSALLGILPMLMIAQPSPDTLSINKLKQLDFMLGTWEGKGWMMMGRGNKQHFNQSEIIAEKAGGLIFAVEGKGTQPDSLTGKEKIIHDAYGIISYNRDSAKYEMTSYSEIRGKMVVELHKISPGVVEWSFKDQRGGTIRFESDYTEKGVWKGLGEYSQDGHTWFQFFETTLKRVD